ncbi:AbiV family abortive infection protein [Amycolatopsis sp. NPDC051071]|uniref:AbiV family abortive infection protein n=1 Tax=Amycolatopsis sp. NPDC051071 TaxID=3154637 RepID=UPI0034362E17
MKALMDNASALVADAHTLLAAGSYGRARSLRVLAQEELGKLAQHGRSHTAK